MRKFFSLILVVAMLAGVSCTTDVTEDLTIGIGGKTELTVSLEGSRIALGDKVGGEYQALWSEGDKISINGIASGEAAIDDANKALATFSFEGALATPYNIVYPAAAAGKVTFAAEQSFVNGTFSAGATPMYGYSESASGVTLQHLAGVLKIGVTGSATLLGAQVSTIDRAPIAGLFDIDCATGEVTATEGATEVVSYSFGDGLALSGEAQYIHIAVPAGVYNELYVTLYDSEGGVMYATVKATDEKPLNAGAVREFTNAITYEATDEVFVIRDVASLQAFAEQAATLEKNAILVNDIDVSEVLWTPIEGYAKTLLGNGYAIKGLKAPLFGTTSASIKGLHLRDVQMESGDNAIRGAMACVVESTETVKPVWENCSASGTFVVENTVFAPTADCTIHDMAYGGLIGYTKGIEITNCVNNIDIHVKQVVATGNTFKVYPYVGGIIGHAYSMHDKAEGNVYPIITGCVNNGELLYEDCSGTANFEVIPVVGGIVGAVCNAIWVAVKQDKIVGAVLTNCTNYGDVTIRAFGGGSNGDSQGYSQTGAAGILPRGSEVELTNCDNYGKITLDGTFYNTFSGGVAGASWYANITDCDNYGAVLMTEESRFGGAMVAGISANNYSSGDYAYTTENCTNNAPISVLGDNFEGISTKQNFNMYRVAGIEGFGRTHTNNCINNKEGVITCKSNYLVATRTDVMFHCVAGVTAYRTSRSQSGNKNHADINVDVKYSIHADVTDTANSLTDSSFHIGGVCGYTTQQANGSVNTGNITIKGEYAGVALFIGGITSYGPFGSNVKNTGNITIEDSTVVSADYLFLGGINAGHDNTGEKTNVVNDGNIYVGGTSKTTWIGGCCAQLRYPNTDWVNNGEIKVASQSCGALHVGGIAGYIVRRYYDSKITTGGSNGPITRAINNGDIYIQPVSTTSTVTIGGICRQGQHHMYDCVNNGDIYVSGSTANTLYIGGVVATNSACERNRCINNGNITVSAEVGTVETGSDIFVGGMCYSGGSNTEYIDCVNNGNITITKDASAANCCRVAGFVPNMETEGVTNTYTRCANNGDIYVAATTSAKSNGGVRIGGILGQRTKGTFKVVGGLKNTGDVTFAGTQNGTTGISLGGIIGGSDGGKATVSFWDAESTGDIINEGKISYIGSTKSAVYIGGITAYFSFVVPAASHKLISTGDILLAGEINNLGSTYVAGLVGTNGLPIEGAQCFCNIDVSKYGDQVAVGFLTARERVEGTRQHKNAKFGGSIATKFDQDDDTMPSFTNIDDGNFLDYIYAAPIDASVAEADGITFITSKDEIVYTPATEE